MHWWGGVVNINTCKLHYTWSHVYNEVILPPCSSWCHIWKLCRKWRWRREVFDTIQTHQPKIIDCTLILKDMWTAFLWKVLNKMTCVSAIFSQIFIELVCFYVLSNVSFFTLLFTVFCMFSHVCVHMFSHVLTCFQMNSCFQFFFFFCVHMFSPVAGGCDRHCQLLPFWTTLTQLFNCSEKIKPILS